MCPEYGGSGGYSGDPQSGVCSLPSCSVCDGLELLAKCVWKLAVRRSSSHPTRERTLLSIE